MCRIRDRIFRLESNKFVPYLHTIFFVEMCIKRDSDWCGFVVQFMSVVQTSSCMSTQLKIERFSKFERFDASTKCAKKTLSYIQRFCMRHKEKAQSSKTKNKIEKTVWNKAKNHLRLKA